MSREVDERIVEMQFDNRQFESGVAKTLNSLDKLTDALKFEGIGNSVRNLQNSVNRMDFSPITNGVGALESTLTSLGGRIKLEVFDRLSKYAVDTGEKIFKALTTQGARAGFAEYETQQGAVQTILANTQHLGTTITDVNGALADLNDYADKTIYNFTEMTRNIGTFTAAGLDLETSTSAIKGIANLAAVSGSTSEQASRAMYQLSQALAAGRVNLMDWNSVVNAGMGGKVFQDSLKRTAKHMGIVVDESKSFRESISGGDTWLTAEVLSETLKQLSGDMDEQALAAQGWSEAEIKEITAMAKTATDAATVVKTFSQLTSTVSEQIGSGWTRTWQLIFGDFEESKQLWTGVYKALSPYIEAMSDLRNTHLQFWKENEGREKIIQAFSNLWSGASDFIDRFTASFRRAFPIVDNFGQVLTDISDRFLKFSERFKVVKDKTEQVTEAFTEVSDAIGKITAQDKKNALDIWNWGNINGNPGRIDGQARVDALGESYDRVQKYINTYIATGYDVAKTDELLGVSADKANEAISKTATVSAQAMTAEEKRDVVLNNMVRTLKNLADVAKIIGGSIRKTVKAAGAAFKDVFDPLMASNDLEKSTSVLTKIARAFEITAEKAEDVKRIFRGVFAAFDIVYQIIRAVAGAIGKALLPSLGAVDKTSGGLLKVLGNFGDWIYALDQAIKEGDLFSVAIEKMISFVSTLDDKVIGVVHSFEKWSGIDFGKVASKIAGAITKGLAKFKEWTGIDIAAIFKAIWERIKTFVGYLKEGDFQGAFTYVAEGFKGFIASMVELIKGFNFKDILSKAGEMFGGIGEWIKSIFDKIFGGAREAGSSAKEDAKKSFSFVEIIGGILYGAFTVIKTALGFLWSVITGPTAKALGQAIKDFFSNLFSKPAEQADEEKSGMEKFKDFMTKLGEALASFYEQVKPIVSAGFSGAFLKSLLDVAKAVKNFSEAPKNFSNALLEFAKGFDNMTKAFHVETMTRFVNALANALIKLVIAIAAIMILDRWEGGVMGAVTVITLLLTEIMGALTFAQKKLDSKLDMVFLAKMLKSIGWVMLELALSLILISKVGDGEKMGAALFTFSSIMLDLMLMLTVMSKIVSSKQFRRGGEGLVMLIAFMDQLGKTMIVMSIAMRILAKISGEQMGVALTGLYGIFGVLALMMAVVSSLAKNLGEGKKDELAAMSAVVMAIAGAFVTMAYGLIVLSVIPEDRLDAALTSAIAIGALIAGILVAVEAFSKGSTNSKAIAAAGAAILGIAVAFDLIVPAIAILAALNPDNLWSTVGAMAAILGAMMLVLTVLSKMGGGNVALAGVGLMALAFAFSIAVPPILIFGKWAVPLLEKAFSSLKKQSGKTIAKIIAAVAGFGLALVVAAVGVAAFGVALVALAIPLSLIIFSVSSLVKAIGMLAPLIAIVAATGSEIGNVLGKAIVNFLKTLVRGAGEIAAAIKESAPQIAEAVLAVLDAILTVTIGRIPVIIEAFLGAIDQILVSLANHLPSILTNLAIIITAILVWLDKNIPTWIPLVVSIIVKFICGVIMGLADRIDEILYTVGYFIGSLIAGIWKLFTGFFDGIFGGKWTKFWEEKGGDAIDNFFELWTTGAHSIKHFFTVTLPEKIKEIWNDIVDIGKSIGSAIASGIESVLPDWWNDAFEGIGGAFAGDVTAPDVEVHDIDYYRKKKQAEQAGKENAQALAKGTKKGESDVKKANAQVANAGIEAMKDGLGTHSASWITEQAGSDVVDGLVLGVDENAYKFDNSMFDLADGGIGTFGQYMNYDTGLDMASMFGDGTADGTEFSLDKVQEIYGDKMSEMNSDDYMKTITPQINVDPDVHMDKDSILKKMNSGFDQMFGKKDVFGTHKSTPSYEFDRNFDVTMGLSQDTAAMEQQRHADAERNSGELAKLNDAITALTENWKGGIINIPENATFTVPVSVDGQAIANVTAPYLDVISGEKMNLERAGATSR